MTDYSKLLSKNNCSPEQYYNNFHYNEDINEHLSKDVLEVTGKIEEVELVGGEGEGDNYHIVIHLTKPDIYLRADAFYASHYGVDDWDEDWSVVEKKEKTITVYE